MKVLILRGKKLRRSDYKDYIKNKCIRIARKILEKKSNESGVEVALFVI